jgi:hypothetical protein
MRHLIRTCEYVLATPVVVILSTVVEQESREVRMAKKKATRKAKKPSKITKGTITFRLTPAEVKRAQACLERTGEIRYTFKDIRLTKLPKVLDDGKLID